MAEDRKYIEADNLMKKQHEKILAQRRLLQAELINGYNKQEQFARMQQRKLDQANFDETFGTIDRIIKESHII